MKIYFMRIIIIYMMLCMSAFAASCTNCNRRGWIEVKCNACNGSGYEIEQKRYLQGQQLYWISYGSTVRTKHYETRDVKVACRKCFKGLRSPTSVGSGKVKETCLICNGKGFVLSKKK